MERESLLETLFSSSTNRILREEQLLNIFGVSDLDDVPTEKLLNLCNGKYISKGDSNHGSKV